MSTIYNLTNNVELYLVLFSMQFQWINHHKMAGGLEHLTINETFNTV